MKPKTTMSNNSNAFKKAQWDKDNSTFYRNILLMGKPLLVGYSKKMGMHERNDKMAVLINWIIRDYESGYLDPKNNRVDRIEKVEYFEKSNDRHLFNLHYSYPEYVDPYLLEDDEFKPVVDFLNKFYTLIKQGVATYEIRQKLYIKGRSRPKEDPLDVSKRRFAQFEDLRNYVADLLLAGRVTPKQAEDFVVRYSEKWFGGAPKITRNKDTFSIGDIIEKHSTDKKKDPLNLDHHRFSNKKMLFEYCKQLVSDGWDQSRVAVFRAKYIEKFFDND